MFSLKNAINTMISTPFSMPIQTFVNTLITSEDDDTVNNTFIRNIEGNDLLQKAMSIITTI